jgi:hypothetical protein
MARNASKLHMIIPGIVWLALLAPAALWAQNTGSISGLVKDPSGALITGASVTITNQNTNGSTTVNSQSDGAYLVPNLISGVYTVAGEAKGFKHLAIAGLKLDAGANLTQDLTLELGAATTSINVTATASLVEATSNMQASTIDSSHIMELPLADREIFALVNLTPSTFFDRTSDDISLNRAAQIVAGGGSTYDSFPSLDGVDNGSGAGSISTVTGYLEVQPPPDSLAEFRVITNNLTAQYGHGALAEVDAVSKSGGNAYHGDVYAFLRNQAADAAGWSLYQTVKPRLQQGSPGLTFGGPIFKNRTFFFFSYEYLFQNIAVSNGEGSVGLPAWYTGNFTTATALPPGGTSAQVVPIYDPLLGDATQISCNGVLNVICPARVVTPATKILSNAPPANHASTSPYTVQNNVWVFPINRTTRPFYMGRLDQKITNNTKMYFRYLAAPQIAKFSGGDSAAWGQLNSSQHNWRTTNNVILGITHLFSPTFFVDAGVGLQREWLFTGNYYNPGANNALTLEGLGVAPTYIPMGTSINSTNIPFDSPGGGIGRLQTLTNIPYNVDFTMVKGRNTFKYGGQVETYNQNAASQSSGTFSFNATYTQGINTATGKPIPFSGIGLADFELGQYSGYSLSFAPDQPVRFQRYALYGQDDLRLTPNLTFNLGLRYETLSPPYSPYNALQSFNPSVPDPAAGTGSIPAGAMGAMLFENLNGQGKYLWEWRKKDGFQPRVGFAYRVGGKSDFVVRGGFALIRDDTYAGGINNTGVLGYEIGISQSYTPTNPSPFIGPTVISPSLLVTPPTSALTPSFGNVGTAFPQSSISFYLPNRLNPYVMQYNLDVQREWKGMLFDVGYIGTFGRHLADNSFNINLIPPALLSQTSLSQAARRPFTEFVGNFASVSENSMTCCVANYNALTFRTERRYANGFSWITAFTWSKWVGNVLGPADVTTAANAPSYQNIYNLKGEEALADNNVPLRLVFSPLVELPFGKGKHWVNQGGVLNQVIGGWMAGFMGTLQAGSPIGPTVASGGTNYLGDNNATLRPNFTAGCNGYSPNKWQPIAGYQYSMQYLNPACFSFPAANTYGTQSRELPDVRGPGIAQFNLSLSKNFYFKERFRIQIRAEAVDLFNTPTFALPAESFNGGSANGFGIITGSDGFTKRIMDFGMKFFF